MVCTFMSSRPEDGDSEQQGAGEPYTAKFSDKAVSEDPDEPVQLTDTAQELEDVQTDIILPSAEVPAEGVEQQHGQEEELHEVQSTRRDVFEASEDVRNQGGLASTNGSVPIPDDLPSTRGSALPSPSSGSISATLSKSGGASASARRPFELRFQSRLSNSYFNPRAGSPAFLAPHSRHASSMSLDPGSDSVLDDTPTPWEVIRWARFKRLTGQAFSEVGRRNFGVPTCLAVGDQIAIGTTKGLVLVFDYQQLNKAILGSGTKAAESGAVTSLAISADHTTLAAGHTSGEIFTWEVARPARPFLHIPAIEATQSTTRKTDGHIKGSAVVHVSFIGYRRTALASADNRGMAFSHLSTRGVGAFRSVRTTRVLGRYPDVVVRQSERSSKKSSVLAFSSLPLGNVEQKIDTLGLVAMLTPYLLVIVSTTPVAQTQFKSPRPKEVAAHSALTAALAWFPAIKLKGDSANVSRNKLAYAWSSVLTILELEEVPRDEDTPEDKPIELQFITRNRYIAEEAIVAVQWLSRSVIAVLTITQQLLVIEDGTMNVTGTSDLLPKNILHADLYSQQLDAVVENHDEDDLDIHGVVADAYHMSLRSYKGRLFLLGSNDLWWGALSNWADRLLAIMETGNYIGAIRLATSYHSGTGEKATIGLPDDAVARSALVRDKLLEMISASLRYVFGRNEQAQNRALTIPQLRELASVCIEACLQIEDQDFLFDDVYGRFEESDAATIFLDVLEPHVIEKDVTNLPAPVFKTFIERLSQRHPAPELEEIICSLDVANMDIDQVANLCKQYNLYDAYIYVWNSALRDYITPLQELIGMAQQPSGTRIGSLVSHSSIETAEKVFPYLSFVLTSRIYPTGEAMADDVASNAKVQIYAELYQREPHQQGGFKTLRGLLHFNAANFLAAMNEAFEDSFLNAAQDQGRDNMESLSPPQSGQLFNRQIIVRVLLEVMSVGFDASDTVFLDMFIARNLPKYPQYMLLSGSVLNQVLTRLCQHRDEDMRDDVQLSIEYLLSVYQPTVLADLVPSLEGNRFWRVLKVVYRQEHDYAALIRAYILDDEPRSEVFTVILDCLDERSALTTEQKALVTEEVKRNILLLAEIDVARTAITLSSVLPHELEFSLDAMSTNPKLQFDYLRALLENSDTTPSGGSLSHSLVERYIRLMCRYDPSHLVDYINNVSDTDLNLLEILPEMESTGTIDAIVVIMTQQGRAREAMGRLLQHFTALRGALRGVLSSAMDSPDEVSTNEAIEDLLDSIDKYTKIGLWLCESQSSNTDQRMPTLKSSPKLSSSAPLTFQEGLWLDLLVAIVNIMQSSRSSSMAGVEEYDDIVSQRLRSTIQLSFTALLNTTSAKSQTTSSGDVGFLRVLRAFLSRVAEVSPSLSHLRHVLASIFSAYAYEESLLSLSNTMLDRDLFVRVSQVNNMRRTGWRPRSQVCEFCKSRAWGTGAGLQIWEAWERDEQKKHAAKKWRPQSSSDQDAGEIRHGKSRAVLGGDVVVLNETDIPPPEMQTHASLVIFSCRHLYHEKCLVQSFREASNGISDAIDTTDAGGERLRCPACH